MSDSIKKAVNAVKNSNRYPAEGTAATLEQLLGGDAELNAYAEIAINQSERLQVASAICLMRHCETNSFSSQEYDAYRKGLEDFVGFFIECASESANRQTKAPNP